MSLEWIVGFLEASDCWKITDHSEAIASIVAVLEPHPFFPRPLRDYLILWKGKELNTILSRAPQTWLTKVSRVNTLSTLSWKKPSHHARTALLAFQALLLSQVAARRLVLRWFPVLGKFLAVDGSLFPRGSWELRAGEAEMRKGCLRTARFPASSLQPRTSWSF